VIWCDLPVTKRLPAVHRAAARSRVDRRLRATSRADLRHRDMAIVMAPTTVTVPVTISQR
jgi:hypothetical protein